MIIFSKMLLDYRVDYSIFESILLFKLVTALSLAYIACVLLLCVGGERVW